MDSENIINVVKYVIKNTPIGHLKETVENLKTLVGSALLENQAVLDEITLYEETHLKQMHLNEDKIIIAKQNKDEEGFYHDLAKNLKIAVNPLNDNIEKISELNVDAEQKNKLA